MKIFIMILVGLVGIIGARADQTLEIRNDLTECRVSTRYHSTRTQNCSFDTVVTAVRSISSGIIQVECSKLVVECPRESQPNN